LGTGHLQVYNFRNSDSLEEKLTEIRDLPGIRGAWMEQQGIGVLVGKKGRNGAAIRALDPSFWDDEGSVKFLKTIAGVSKPETNRDVLLGEEMAGSIGAEVGDTIRIMTIRVASDGRNIPRVTPFTVKGIVSSGYRELDALWCITTREAGRNLLAGELSSSHLIIKTDDPYDGAQRTALSLYNVLGSGFSVYTWKELQRSQYSSYESTRQLLLFIMALIVIVAAVNVSSATSMLVIERQRDIAVLKAGGITGGGVTGIFLWGSLLTGLSGAVLGIGAGLLLGNFINPVIRFLERVLSFISGIFHGSEVKILDSGYYLERIPVVIDWTMVFIIGLFTVLCSIAASMLPAWRADKLRPLDLLRKY
jgi:lipoprotein-releasing system permease protein